MMAASATRISTSVSGCTVRIESDLLERAEIEALVERYGTAISFDTSEGSHPVLLPLKPRRR